MEQLTTPEMKKQDVVYPGENWFFYWRTSPSLWESKLKSYSGVAPIFVPINWSLHSEYSDQFDFGDTKPETDLLKLNEVAQQAGRKLIFFIPLSPMPFLAHGGIPTYLAHNIAENRDRLAISVIDNSEQVNKIYSFYDPKIFQAFRKFIFHLGQYFSQLGINAPIFGMDSMRFESEHIVSFFNDDSAMFEIGFSRYLNQLEEDEPNKILEIKRDVSLLSSLKADYCEIIKKLYLDASKEALSGHWAGTLKVCHLGGSTVDLFKRTYEKSNNEGSYFKPLFLSLAHNIYPSSTLLGFDLKKESLGQVLSDIVTTTFAQVSLDKENYADDFSHNFKPLFFFELFNTEVGHLNIEKEIQQAGLKHYLGNELPWSVKITENIPVDFDEFDPRRIHFFLGAYLDEKSFHQVLKLFLSGLTVFIDVKGLDSKLIDKLDVFFIENNIQTEKINFISPVLKATLGDGFALTYDSSKLQEVAIEKRAGFWEKIFSYMEVKHLKIDAENGVEYFWRARSSNTYELNFEEIRRVSFYNPTNDKKKVFIKTSKNFAFVKHLDEINSKVKTTPTGIEIALMAGGSVTLDFGYFDI